MLEVKNIEEDYHGPTKFDYVIPFGETFEYMRASTVPIKSRIKRNSKSLRFLGFTNPEVAVAMHKITKLANDPQHSTLKAPSRYLYQKYLADVFGYIVEEALENKDNFLIIAPLRAGDLIAKFYKVEEKKIFRIEAKRLPMKDGTLQLGLIGKFKTKITPETTVLIAEGCVATGITVAGLLKFISDFETKPSLVEVNAAAISQLGADYLLKQAETLGLPLFIRGAIPVYALDEHFYLLRTPEEGYKKPLLTVGDAGDWSLPLPEEYNDHAWWNKGRNRC